MSSFTEKLLQVNFTLAGRTFGEGKGNTKIVKGLRVSCNITKKGQPSKNEMRLNVFGMLESDMNALTNLSFKPLKVGKNYVQVLAGDIYGMAVAFQGEITGAWASYQSPPNLQFHVEAIAGFYPSIAPANPKSYSGGVEVASVMADLAAQMEYTFENNNVKVKLADPYFPGTAYNQARMVASAADIEFGIDDGVLFIAPRGTARKGAAPLVSADTGMISYPMFDKKGLKVKTMYNPAIKLGGLIVVKSEIHVANGTWRVVSISHHLESMHPGGKWQSDIKASYVGG